MSSCSTNPRRAVRICAHARRAGTRCWSSPGEIDIAAAVEIQPSLDAATEGPAPRVVIDLTDIEFFDCSGLRLLYRARRRVLDHDGRIHLVCTHPLTLRVLRLTGLGKLLPPQATLEAALALPEAASGTL
ncbi:anti-sigma factor antagonist [Streptomyces thermocoprophilus]